MTDELTSYLRELGATDEDLDAFADELPGLAAVLLLRGKGERLTIDEVADRAGVTAAFVSKVYRAAGFAEPERFDRVFDEDSVAVFRSTRDAEEVFGSEAVLQLTRVIGSSLARIADATVSAFHVHVEAGIDDPSGMERARANALVASMFPMVSEAMDVMLRNHIIAARRPLHASSGLAQRLTVGFADLVGSTALAQELPMAELSEALSRFEQRASDVVQQTGGRVVKHIGDEIMFTFAEPASACEAALRLTEAFEDDELLPPVRVGLAAGDVLSRHGDVYGPVVNLAARIVKLARPGTVLAGRDLAGSVDGAFTVVPIPPRRLRGFDGRVEISVVRREGIAIGGREGRQRP